MRLRSNHCIILRVFCWVCCDRSTLGPLGQIFWVRWWQGRQVSSSEESSSTGRHWSQFHQLDVLRGRIVASCRDVSPAKIVAGQAKGNTRKIPRGDCGHNGRNGRFARGIESYVRAWAAA